MAGRDGVFAVAVLTLPVTLEVGVVGPLADGHRDSINVAAAILHVRLLLKPGHAEEHGVDHRLVRPGLGEVRGVLQSLAVDAEMGRDEVWVGAGLDRGGEHEVEGHEADDGRGGEGEPHGVNRGISFGSDLME